MKKSSIEPKLFWPGLILITITSLLLVLVPGIGKKVDSVLWLITHAFDWLFLGMVFSMFVFLIWLAFSRYGDIKFGSPEEKPEFSTFSWIAMLFNAGIGSSLFYWAMVEPIYYISGPPFGIVSNSKEAAEWAVTYGMFHWGFSAWGTYAIPALVIAYSLHIRKSPVLRPSAACKGILGSGVDGWIGIVIDLMVMIGLVGGIGTALGVNVPMISTLVSNMLSVPDDIKLQLVILTIWTLIFGASAYLGVKKGIQKLSDLNSIVALILLLFIFVAGPALFILSNFANSIGLLLDNFLRMSFYTDPISKSGFPQDWTVFYWAWCLPLLFTWACLLQECPRVEPLKS